MLFENIMDIAQTDAWMSLVRRNGISNLKSLLRVTFIFQTIIFWMRVQNHNIKIQINSVNISIFT